MKYVSKQQTIEAFQFDGDLIDSNGKPYVPNWAIKAFEDEEIVYNKDVPYELYIQQKNNYIHVPVGNYVLLIDNSLYTCEKSLFENLYKE